MVVVLDSKVPERLNAKDNGPPPSYLDAPPEYDHALAPISTQLQASTSSSATQATSDLSSIPFTGSPVTEDTPITEPEYSGDTVTIIDKISLFQLYGDIKGVLRTQRNPSESYRQSKAPTISNQSLTAWMRRRNISEFLSPFQTSTSPPGQAM